MVEFFTRKGADLPSLCSVCSKYMYVYFQKLFDLSSKQTSKIDIFLFGEIRSSGEGKITHECVCVCMYRGYMQLYSIVHKHP